MKFLDALSEKVGIFTSWLTSVLVLLVCYDVFTRYVLDKSWVAVQELEWHIFAVIFLLGAAYTLRHDKHVRVDLVYQTQSLKTKAWINLLGTVLLLLPFCAVVIWKSLSFVESSWEVGEQSPDYGGLPARYILKAFIPLSFFLLALQGIAFAIRSLRTIVGRDEPETSPTRPKLLLVLAALAPPLLVLSFVVHPAVFLFLALFYALLFGFPVAFTLGGVALLFGLQDLSMFNFLPSRIYGVMGNGVLIAVPLFIFMGIMLEKSGIAGELLETMALLFGRIRGGLAVSVVVVGTLLAASTGIVGATVVTMGLLSLPTMLKRGYDPKLATGTICASGTLGQIIPPSIVLVLLGSILQIDIGSMFIGAVVPGLILVILYLVWIGAVAIFRPAAAPAMPPGELEAFAKERWRRIFRAFLPPMVLIVIVLGSILRGIASPTEASAVGAMGATVLTLLRGKFRWKIFQEVMSDTTKITCMVFIILVGATALGLVFRLLGGPDQMHSLRHDAADSIRRV